MLILYTELAEYNFLPNPYLVTPCLASYCICSPAVSIPLN